MFNVPQKSDLLDKDAGVVVIDFFFFAQSQQRAQGTMIGRAKVHGPPASDIVSE